jgi:poly(A) polymerase
MLVYEAAQKICKTLFEEGFTAYFAGGWVRDYLLALPTEEIDIATNAPPEVIQRLFPKTIPVGIAFGVVIVVQGDLHFEVSTFRKDHPYTDGRHPDGVDFSTPEKDAMRRDFTINGMFYDPLGKVIYDYVGGQEDLRRQIVRAIGDPRERFAEDRLRMIRAVRFTSRFSFHLDEATAEAIRAYASTLFPSVSIERIWQELNKMAAHPHFDQALIMLHRLGLLGTIFPELRHQTEEEIAKRVAFFPFFPQGAPTIVFLLELFDDWTATEKLRLCLYLKTSAQEKRIVDFFEGAKSLFARSPSLDEWAHFYAHPLSTLYLEIEKVKRPAEAKEHLQRYHQLSIPIHRIQNKTPLVTAVHLLKMGIDPGEKMGFLLKRAERIAIQENLHTPEDVLKRLQKEISDL